MFSSCLEEYPGPALDWTGMESTSWYVRASSTHFFCCISENVSLSLLWQTIIDRIPVVLSCQYNCHYWQWIFTGTTSLIGSIGKPCSSLHQWIKCLSYLGQELGERRSTKGQDVLPPRCPNLNAVRKLFLEPLMYSRTDKQLLILNRKCCQVKGLISSKL